MRYNCSMATIDYYKQAHIFSERKYQRLLKNYQQELVTNAQIERLYEQLSEDYSALLRLKPVDKLRKKY